MEPCRAISVIWYMTAQFKGKRDIKKLCFDMVAKLSNSGSERIGTRLRLHKKRVCHEEDEECEEEACEEACLTQVLRVHMTSQTRMRSGLRPKADRCERGSGLSF